MPCVYDLHELALHGLPSPSAVPSSELNDVTPLSAGNGREELPRAFPAETASASGGASGARQDQSTTSGVNSNATTAGRTWRHLPAERQTPQERTLLSWTVPNVRDFTEPRRATAYCFQETEKPSFVGRASNVRSSRNMRRMDARLAGYKTLGCCLSASEFLNLKL